VKHPNHLWVEKVVNQLFIIIHLDLKVGTSNRRLNEDFLILGRYIAVYCFENVVWSRVMTFNQIRRIGVNDSSEQPQLTSEIRRDAAIQCRSSANRFSCEV
jgi:hypothetical protein